MSRRVHRHTLSQLLCLGRHTLTGLLGTAGRMFCDWSSDYRMYSSERIQAQKLFGSVRQALVNPMPSDHPVVVAVDDTRLPKTGRKTHGVKYVRDPLGPPFGLNLIKAQRFLQISMACVADQQMARMIPIDFVHAPAPQKPRDQADESAQLAFSKAQKDMALPRVAAGRLQELRQALDEDGQPGRSLWTVVDGGYTNHTFLQNLPSKTMMIGRIRADAKLYYLPGSSQGKPGRNRVYGLKAPTPQQVLQDDSVPWQYIAAFAAGKTHQFKIKTLTPLRWRSAGKTYDLRLIVIAPLGYRLTKTSRLLYRKAAFLICTDPNAAIEQVLQAYLWRWDIEVNFRDEKTLLGIGQAQVRHERSVENVPALAVAAYAMLLTSAIQAFGPTGKPDSLPAPKWRRDRTLRASTQSLMNHLRHEAWARAIHFSGFVSRHESHTNPEKSQTCLEGAVFYATG
jgi:hypothetical protein